MLSKVISGGQTGADRAAWDAAIAAGIETGGFVPKGRAAEDGPIPLRYQDLVETETDDPAERTRLNVISSDATLVITHGPPIGGTRLTVNIADQLSKPLLQIDLFRTRLEESAEIAERWIRSNGVKTLNIAGPRASDDALIYDASLEFLRRLFTSF